MVGENRMARLMQEWGMRALVMRVYHRMTKRMDDLKALPNHRLAVEKAVAVNQQWSSDVTYIKLSRRCVLPAVVLDLFSRRVVTWRLDCSVRRRKQSAGVGKW